MAKFSYPLLPLLGKPLAAVLLSSSLLLPITATAADPGTYRPGTAYNSITAGSADVCESQCSGDAQCRSWNYITISRQVQTREGVCEFNDTLSSPVPSSVSISGENATRRSSTKLVAGRTNTVRVGAPSMTQNMTQAKAVVSRPSPTRRVVREAVPQRIRPRTSAYQAPRQQAPLQQAPLQQAMQAQRPTMQQPRFRHNLDEPSAPNRSTPRSSPPRSAVRPQAPQYAAPRGNNSYNQADPRLKQRLQQAARGQAAPSRPSQSAALSAPPGVPPMAANSKYAQQMPPASARPSPAQPSGPSLAGRASPQTRAAQRPQQAPRPQRRVNIPSELSPRPLGTEPSLFGSLYDDVKIPRPLDPAIAADEGAPIPTVLSVPVGPVETTQLPPLY